VLNSSHYAVLYYDIDEHTVTVFDGLNMDICNWQEHIIYTVKTYGLKPLFSSATCKFRYDDYVDERVTKRRKLDKRNMTLEICFDDLKEPCHVKNKQSYVQGLNIRSPNIVAISHIWATIMFTKLSATKWRRMAEPILR